MPYNDETYEDSYSRIADETTKRVKRIRAIASIAIVATLVFALIINSIGIVPRNHVGILIRAGVVQEQELTEGWKLKIPIVDKIESMSNEVQTIRIATGNVKDPTTTETAETKDRQLIPTFDFEIQYQLSKDQSFTVYKNYGKKYEQRLISNNATAIIKQVFSMYNAEEIVEKKLEIPERVMAMLNEFTSPLGIEIKRVNMKNYDFTPEYTAILQARQESETRVIRAEAEAEANRISAENDAYVITTRAQAEKEARLASAEATRAELDAQASGLNDLVIQRQFLEKWNGQLLPNFGGDNGFTFTNMTDIIKAWMPQMNGGPTE